MTSARRISAGRSRPGSSATRSTKPWSSDSPTSISVMPRSCSGASTATPRRRRAPSSFHIGRLAVADEQSEPVVVDWRAPVAEPFYRATGREPMGLVRRRHFAVEGRTLLGIEDELFGGGHLGVGHDDGLVPVSPNGDGDGGVAPRPELRGYSTLLAALERSRTGHARRHRRHDPGRAGRDHPLAPARRAGRAGRSGHRQDGRRPPPRRLPAVHPPLPAGGPGRAGHRPQPGVPALHRAGAAVARRGRRRAGRARRPRARRRASPAPRPRRSAAGRPGQGRRPHVGGHRQGGQRPRAAAARGPRKCRSAPDSCGSRRATRRAS